MEQHDTYNESEVLKSLAEGSAMAFDNLYHRYYEAVRANIFKVVRNDETTDDLLQEVFITLWEKRERFRDYDRISGWLFVASYNRSMNYLRRLAVSRTAQKSLREIGQAHEDPADTARYEEQVLLLEKAIELLPPQRRKVFELCRLRGMTYEQAASELSISKNTVKEHLARAAESIRAYVQLQQGQTGQQQKLAFILFFIGLTHPF